MNYKVGEKEKRTCVLAAFIIFFLLIVLQHSYAWIQFDDYGYASLFYARNQSLNVDHFTLRDIIKYLYWHYMNWGGRVVCFFEEILVLQRGIKFTRFIQSVVVWAGVYLSWRLVIKDNKEKKLFVLSFLLMCYGLMAKETVTDGIFWFTASFVYFWPYITFLAAVCLDYKYSEKRKKIYLFMSVFCFFLSGFSQEQTGFAVIIFIIFELALNSIVEKRRPEFWEYAKLAAAGIGFAFMFFAPGNFVRLDLDQEFKSLSFGQKLALNIPKLLENNFGIYNWRFLILLFITGIFMLIVLIKNTRNRIGKIVYGIFMSGQFFGLLYILYKMGKADKVSCFIIGITISDFLIILLAFLVKEYMMSTIPFLFMGLATQGVMVISPTITCRTHLVFELSMYLVLAFVWERLLNALRRESILAAMVVLCVVAVSNLGSIIKGYKDNSWIHELNHNNLVEAKLELDTGEEVEEVDLYKLKDDSYVSQMGYQQDFIEIYMKEYYKLPQSIQFIWKENARNAY